MHLPWIIDYTFTFVRVFAIGFIYFSPILFSFLFLIALCGWITGRLEKWSHFDSFYYAFVTATTVGYGDLKPKSRRAKVLAIAIAFLGILFTGFTVTLGIHAGSICFKKYPVLERVEAAAEANATR